MRLARTAALALGLSAVLLPLLAGPSVAAPMRFSDPPGDANYIAGGFRQSPHPSDPELDILKVVYATTADSLVLTIEVQKFGVPLGAAQASFVWAFSYNDIPYGVSVDLPAVEDAIPEEILPKGPTFWKRESGGSLECLGCTVAHEPAANLVRVVLPLKSMSAAMRAADPGQPELRRGSIFRELWVLTDRMRVATPVGDWASPGRRSFVL